jgi:hypothetical protein
MYVENGDRLFNILSAITSKKAARVTGSQRAILLKKSDFQPA